VATLAQTIGRRYLAGSFQFLIRVRRLNQHT